MEEEEADFLSTTAARSRLSSLFQSDVTRGEDVNDALTFTAPKQPKKNVQENAQTAGTLKLLHSATVHGFKLIEGNYVSQGKLGCAILGLHDSSSYKVLLYKGKQLQVTFCNIDSTFKFHVQSNNYANFYDENNENWSINFDSQTVLIEFAKQVALAKANSEGRNPRSLIVQDLVLGEGPQLGSTDSADIRYTGWQLSNYGFGQVFDSNMQAESALRVRMGKSKIIKGWSEGLFGVRKNSRRLLFVPSHLASEGSIPSVPPNTTLIFEVFIPKVKVSRESSHSPSPLKVQENIPEKKPEVTPRSSFSQEDNVRMRGASISEQLSQSPKKDKAQLISRMAKMGMATLPFKGAVAAHVSSESENEEENHEDRPGSHSENSRAVTPNSIPEHNSHKSSSFQPPVAAQPVQQRPPAQGSPFEIIPHSSQLFSQPTMAPVQTFVSSPATTFPTYATPYSLPQYGGLIAPPPAASDAHLSLLAAEVRGHNTEVRLNLSKITDKLDTIRQVIDESRNNERFRSERLPSSSTFMEGSSIIQNIERIVLENTMLKKDVEEKNSKIENLNQKIYDLVDRNQRFFEEKNAILEKKSDSFQAVSEQSQAKISNLEAEKAKLVDDLSTAKSRVSSLECELKQFQTIANRNEEVGKQAQESESNFRDQLSKVQKEKNLFQSELEDLKKRHAEALDGSSDTEKKIHSLLEELETLKKENARLVEEKDTYVSENRKLKSNLEKVTDLTSSLQGTVRDLQKDLEQSLLWKKKFEILYEKTRVLKETYESRINELVAELTKLKDSGSTASSSDFSGELKRVMNALYKLLQGKFSANSSYTGSNALDTILQSIKVLTFQMLEKKSQTFHPTPQVAERKNSGTLLPDAKLEQNGLEKSSVVSASGDSGQQQQDIEESVSSTNLETQLEQTLVENEIEKEDKNSASATSDSVDIDNNSEGVEKTVPPKESDPETKTNEAISKEIKEVEQKVVKETASSASPDMDDETLRIACGNLVRKLMYAFALIYLLFWIGARLHDLEASEGATPL